MTKLKSQKSNKTPPLPCFKYNHIREMLTNSFYMKNNKIINVINSFYISQENDVKIFLLWFISDLKDIR